MANTPFPLEHPTNNQLWNLDIDQVGNLEFNSNSTSGGNTRMVINDDTGNIGIGTAPTNSKLEIDAGSSDGLRVTNNNVNQWSVRIQNSQDSVHETGMRMTNDGFFEVTNRINGFTGLARLNSTGAWTIQSDLKSKTDIKMASGLLEKALSLRTVDFYYKGQDLTELPHKFLGFIAQEVEEILPEAVDGTEKKYLNYNSLVPVAIGAIKEIKQYYDEKIANLEKQLAQLQKA